MTAVGGIEAVDARYVALLARAQAVFAGDARVVRVEPGGSIANGEADAWSDLDLHVYVRPDDHAAVVAEWPRWLAEITPTVFARTPILPFIVNCITDDGLTLDFAVLRADTPPFTRPTGFAVGMLSGTYFDDHAGAVEYAVAELFRCLCGPFITDYGRNETVRPLTGAGHLLGLLATVMYAETSAPPPSAKQPSAALTDDQRATLAGLPPLHARRDAAATWTLALAADLIRRARPLFDQYGLDWPTQLEHVARARLASVGLSLP